MNLNEITREALTEAISIARQLGFSGQEGGNTPLTQNLQIGQTLFSSPYKQDPSLRRLFDDSWRWGP